MTKPVADFLAACVRGRLDMLITGGTGTGKTTTLNVLSQFLPADERIVTIEDAAELQLHQEHVLRLESRPPNIEGRGQVTVRDLVRNSLRMRPDRIVIGEVRDGAALDMLQAMNTGHDGSLTTVHANSPRDSLARIETMVLMSGMDLPVRAIREQAASAIDLIIHQTRLKDGSRRITHITEVAGMEGDVDHAAGHLPVRLPGRHGRVRPLPRDAAADRPAAAVRRPARRDGRRGAAGACSATGAGPRADHTTQAGATKAADVTTPAGRAGRSLAAVASHWRPWPRARPLTRRRAS